MMIGVRQILKWFKASWFSPLLVTMIGVLLALFFENMIQEFNLKSNKQISIQNIKQEIIDNIESVETEKNNDSLMAFFKDLLKQNDVFSKTITIHQDSMMHFQKKHEVFFEIKNKKAAKGGAFTYELNFNYHISLIQVSDIAWQTALLRKSAIEIDYECLQGLVYIYDMQKRFVVQQDKLLDAMISRQEEKVFHTLGVVQQLKTQFLEILKEAQEEIDVCFNDFKTYKF